MNERPPWSHELKWIDIQSGVARFDLVADNATRERIRRVLNLEAIPSLIAELAIKPWLDGIELNGRVTATVTRLCGVSLEPFDEVVDEPISIRVVPAGSANLAPEESGPVIVDLQDDDPPDSLTGDSIDVAGYVVEHLSLALDPFPRKPGAVFTQPTSQPSLSPFSVLAALKQNAPDE